MWFYNILAIFQLFEITWQELTAAASGPSHPDNDLLFPSIKGEPNPFKINHSVLCLPLGMSCIIFKTWGQAWSMVAKAGWRDGEAKMLTALAEDWS